ncbi:MAG: DUF3667 domain-containing protein [Bacteroidetes bacterium]|nr:DUF3667 domain-containing protein [Bacteroidota bacterium]
MSDSEKYCRNCGTMLSGQFCSSCGQKDVDIHVPVKELASEFIELLPSFDKRLLRSLQPLLFDPGSLTLAYLSGKRRQYLSPFKMYFIISFLFFLTGSLRDDSEKRTLASSMLNKDTAAVVVPDTAKGWSVQSSRSNMRLTISDSTDAEELFGAEGKLLLGKLKANPDLLFEKVKEHRSKIIFILLPVFAILLKILYIRSRLLYIRHLVFSFNFHSFVFLILLLTSFVELMHIPFAGYLSAVLYLGIPVNLFTGMKHVYGQSGTKTILKMLLLSGMYAVTFLTTFTLAAVIIIYLFYR